MSGFSGIPLMAACTVLLALACLSAGCTSGPVPAQTTGTPASSASSLDTITIKDFAFSPAALTIKTGTTVTWVNDDSAPHTVVSDDGAPAPFTSPQLATGASFPQRFAQAGTYAYHCSIHPSMKGTVVVES